MRPDHLIKMTNQIAISVPDRASAAQQMAAHLKNFWSPAMIDALADYAAGGATDVSPEVVSALALLRRP